MTSLTLSDLSVRVLESEIYDLELSTFLPGPSFLFLKAIHLIVMKDSFYFFLQAAVLS